MQDILRRRNRKIVFFVIVILIFTMGFIIVLSTKGETKKSYSDFILKENSIKRIEGRVKKWETFSDILQSHGVSWADIVEITKKTKDVYNLSKITWKREYEVIFKNGQFYGFIYKISPKKYLIVLKDGRRISSKLVHKEVKNKVSPVKIRVSDSLYNAMIKAGEKPYLAESIASIFEYEIDFNSEIRKGDTFKVLVEKEFIEGEFYGYRKILYASAILSGKKVEAIRFRNKEGRESFYHPDGKALERIFLRSPLPFFVVTSRFGYRFHPVLGFSAKHNGVDLRAPVGTPIRAVGDGIVLRAGYSRYKGRFIVLKHKNGYKTHYYHLSRFARGIRRGKRVKQKQIIGYTGNTGLSTGPHLHYGISKYGRFLNPLRFRAPSLKPLPKKFLPELMRLREEYLKRLEDKS